VPRQRRPSQYQPWGPKLPGAKLRGRFYSFFFLEGQNRNFEKVRGLKLQLSLKFIINHCDTIEYLPFYNYLNI